MEVNGDKWDKLLKIRTSGRDDSMSDYYHYPYEPTPYRVLMRLADSGMINKRNTLIDYGCGKGRVSFYLAYQTRCKCIGIDFNKNVLDRALSNKESAVSGMRCDFYRADAERFIVPFHADRFFFFNPFSREILSSVMGRILESFYEEPRDMLLFFYYPSDEYRAYLATIIELSFETVISCGDLFFGDNNREVILVYRLSNDGF